MPCPQSIYLYFKPPNKPFLKLYLSCERLVSTLYAQLCHLVTSLNGLIAGIVHRFVVSKQEGHLSKIEIVRIPLLN